MSEEKTQHQRYYDRNQGHHNWVRDIKNADITVPPGEDEYIKGIMPDNELDKWRMNFLSLKPEEQQELIGKWENLKKSPSTDKRKYAEDMQNLLRESKIPNAPQIPLDEYMHILDTKVKILEERCNYIFAPLSGGKKKTIKRKWSLKYKRSINCRKPKGFSQKQYCKRVNKKRRTRRKKSRKTKRISRGKLYK